MKESMNKYLSNSYCVEYDEEENVFIVALANKENEDDVDLRGAIFFDRDNFKEYVNTIMKAIIKFEESTGEKFIDVSPENEGVEEL